MVGLYVSFHSLELLYVPRIRPPRLRRNCTSPMRSRLRHILHIRPRPCRCLPRRRILRSSTRPLRTPRMHPSHLLRSCTCPPGCPIRRTPVCHRDNDRKKRMITNGLPTPFQTTITIAYRQQKSAPHHLVSSVKCLYITFETSEISPSWRISWYLI